MKYSSDVAFTNTVKDVQERKGSRRAYNRMETNGSWQTEISSDLASFISSRTSAYLATTNVNGQPYVQHRGGPAGFMKVMDRATIGFADFTGNRQYITQGNLLENEKAFLFLMDYTFRQRVKIWGTARLIENDAELLSRLMPADYHASPEGAILFTVSAWDANCHQHIPRLVDAETIHELLREKDRKIELLQKEVDRLKAGC